MEAAAMKRRMLSAILALTMAFSCLPATAFGASDDADEISTEISEDNTPANQTDPSSDLSDQDEPSTDDPLIDDTGTTAEEAGTLKSEKTLLNSGGISLFAVNASNITDEQVFLTYP
jgi:hypothetical protein